MRAETHLLASTDGYTTKAASGGLDPRDRNELEELIHGQPDDPATLSGLASQPTALVRQLRGTGRYAISRILPGANDSAGRQTIAICSLILSAQDYVALASRDLWPLVTAKNLWRMQVFDASQAVQISALAASSRPVTNLAIQLIDAWIRARDTPRGLAVAPAGVDQDRAILALPSLLAEEDRGSFLWGCRLLSAQAPVQVATFVRAESPANARRVVVPVGPLPPSALDAAAVRCVGSPAIPPLRTLTRSVHQPYGLEDSARGVDAGAARQEWGSATGIGARLPSRSSSAQVQSMRMTLIIAASVAALLVAAATVGTIVWGRYRPPLAVQQLVCQPTQSQDGVSVTWRASPEAASYQVERRIAREDTWISLPPIPATAGDGPDFIDPDVLPLDDVTYRITAVSATGTPSEAVESTRFRVPIPTPTGLRATLTGGKLQVSWDRIRGATECFVTVHTTPAEPPAERLAVSLDGATFAVGPDAAIASISLRLMFPSGTSEPYDVPCGPVSQRVAAPGPIPKESIRLTGCPPHLQLEFELPAGAGCEVEYEGLDDQVTKATWSPDKGTALKLPLAGEQKKALKVKVKPFSSDAQGNIYGELTEHVRPYISQFKATPSEQSLSIKLDQAPPANWQVCVSVSLSGQGGGTEPLKGPCKASGTIEIPMTDLDRFRQAEEVEIDVSAWLSPIEASDSSCPQPTSPRTVQVHLPPRPTASNAEPSRGLDFATVAQTFFGPVPGLAHGDIDTLPPEDRAKADMKFKTEISTILTESRVDGMKLSKSKQEATEALKKVSLKIVEFLGPPPTPPFPPDQLQCQRARRLLDAPELMSGALLEYANLKEGEGDTAPRVLREALQPIQEWLKKFDASLGCDGAQQKGKLLESIGEWKKLCKDYDAHKRSPPKDPEEITIPPLSDQERKDRKTKQKDWEDDLNKKRSDAKNGCTTVLCLLLTCAPKRAGTHQRYLKELFQGNDLPSEESCDGMLPRIRYAAKRALGREVLDQLFWGRGSPQ